MSVCLREVILLRVVFVDANETLAAVAERVVQLEGLEFSINRDPGIKPDSLPELLKGASVAIIDHTALSREIAEKCTDLRHVVFLGTGARSYMNPEELQAIGITVHTIKGYGDTAVAEFAISLMWAAAKGLATMDRGIREGRWLRTNGLQLTGKTLGLVGFGGIATECSRLALGIGMKVVAWNRTPRSHPGVDFLDVPDLLAQSDVVSLHLLLTDETRGFMSRERLKAMKPGAILVNTARGALIDDEALIEALTHGPLAHAAMDVFDTEPLPAGHPFTRLENVTLSAHSAFRTPEASDNLLAAARDHCRRIMAAS
ncbi:D-3-phosphoglycerate dehydrogenase [Rhodoligotrophos appendicifer]|uniref:NAD(P)-dependent oxidoreductase n=1 Tax=Rhodoligotrophos appendicifer TaxID=987056 RepID=UPI001FE9449D|nr:NAD(P)-dependent oxidoreductase [Rhodoligotrophos appendicifer]